MDAITISSAINDKISELEDLKALIQPYYQEKVKHLHEGEKALAKAIVGLRNGISYDFEGQKIVNPPIGIIEKVARGVVSDVLLKQDVADAKVKALMSQINVVIAQLNGYQSIYKHLEEI